MGESVEKSLKDTVLDSLSKLASNPFYAALGFVSFASFAA